jgi:hypothetical protein
MAKKATKTKPKTKKPAVKQIIRKKGERFC